jgi:methylmalonyl-CoA mutase cobalamin-binding domain/chain
MEKSAKDMNGSAIQEDVKVIGLSILPGAHLGLTAKLMKKRNEEGIDDKFGK